MKAFITVLLSNSISAAVVIVTLLVIKAVCGRKIPARWLYCMWILVLMCLFMPIRPDSPVSVLNAVPLAQAETPVVLNTADYERVNAMPPLMQNTQIITGTNPSIPYTPSAQTQPLPPPSIYFWLTCIWAIGALITMSILAVNNLRFWRRFTGTRADADTQSLCDAICKEIGLSRRVYVYICPDLTVPCISVLYPRILLTQDALNDEGLRYILLHELCHIKQHDVVVAWLRCLMLIVYWFHPLVWLAERHVRDDAELSCDAVVLGYVPRGKHTAYGMTLLRMIPRRETRSLLTATMNLAARRSLMKERVYMLAHIPKKSIVTAVFLVILTISLAACTLTGAMTNITEPTEQEQQSSIGSPITTPAPTFVPVQTSVTLEAEPTPLPVVNYLRDAPIDPFTVFDENAYERYALAAERINEKEPLLSANFDPANPQYTGFAMIPLNKEKYGTDYFVVLPNRPLTDNEMQKLAFAMGGMDATEFTRQHMSIGGQWYAENNRFMTESEMQRMNELTKAYRYNGIRPEGELSTNPEDGDPMVITLNPEFSSGLTEINLYPSKEMSDEQILRLIARHYDGYFTDDLKAPPSHMTYEQAAGMALEYTRQYLDFQITGDIVTVEGDFYSRNKGGMNVDYYIMTVYSPSEPFAYNIRLKSEDGALLEMSRTPSEIFNKDYIPKLNFSEARDYPYYGQTDKMLDAAEAFVKKVLADGERIASGAFLDGKRVTSGNIAMENIATNEGFYTLLRVQTNLNDYYVGVSLTDLGIVQVCYGYNPFEPYSEYTSNEPPKYGELVSWYDANGLWAEGETVSVIDFRSKRVFNATRVFTLGENDTRNDFHADFEPATLEDTGILFQCYGEWSWNRRPVLVHIGGKWIAASIIGMPHSDDRIRDNGITGVLCMHFQDSLTHGTAVVDDDHQRAVREAAGY